MNPYEAYFRLDNRTNGAIFFKDKIINVPKGTIIIFNFQINGWCAI